MIEFINLDKEVELDVAYMDGRADSRQEMLDWAHNQDEIYKSKLINHLE